MKTILTPTDFSSAGRRAGREAAKLAHLIGGRLVVVHIVTPPPIIMAGYNPILIDIPGITAKLEQASARKLVSLQKSLKKIHAHTIVLQETGIPVEKITNLERKLKADYIVIGSHGHTAFFELLIGSVTSGVLKRAQCPVMVIAPPSPRKKPAKPVSRRPQRSNSTHA